MPRVPRRHTKVNSGLALRTGDVLSIGTMTESATKTLPTVYFASDPSAAAMHATTPSLPGQYDICGAQPDPDNVLSVNKKNPHILDGIVVPLGQTWNPDKATNDCCNYASLRCTAQTRAPRALR